MHINFIVFYIMPYFLRWDSYWIYFLMDMLQETVDVVTFTEDILNVKFHFLRSTI